MFHLKVFPTPLEQNCSSCLVIAYSLKAEASLLMHKRLLAISLGDQGHKKLTFKQISQTAEMICLCINQSEPQAVDWDVNSLELLFILTYFIMVCENGGIIK